MKAIAVAGGICALLFAGGIGGLYWIQNSPGIAADAVLIENREVLDMAARHWGMRPFAATDRVAVLDRGDGYHEAFYHTEKQPGQRGSLFSITIRKEAGLWELKRGPALASEIE